MQVDSESVAGDRPSLREELEGAMATAHRVDQLAMGLLRRVEDQFGDVSGLAGPEDQVELGERPPEPRPVLELGRRLREVVSRTGAVLDRLTAVVARQLEGRS